MYLQRFSLNMFTEMSNANISNIVDQYSNGLTRLMTACLNSRVEGLESVQLLIDMGANLELLDRNGSTALALSCRSSKKTSTLETVKLLIDNKANVNHEKSNGISLLMSACGGYLLGSPCLDTIKTLIEAGADVNKMTDGGRCPLNIWVPSTIAKHKLTDILIKAKADVNAVSPQGTTILMSLVSQPVQDINSTKLILDAKADVNKETIRGTAISMCNKKINLFENIKLLLEYGAVIGNNTDRIPGKHSLDICKLIKIYSPNTKLDYSRADINSLSEIIKLDIEYDRWMMYHKKVVMPNIYMKAVHMNTNPDSHRLQLLFYKYEPTRSLSNKTRDICSISDESISSRLNDLDRV